VALEDQASRPPWEAPAATALTETESRADEADVLLQNGPPQGS
jgi:hypothetical protein